MDSNAHAVLAEIHAHGGSCDYDELLDATDAEPKTVHFTASMLQRDGYIYEPTDGTVGLV